jgi:Toastrack DUF4097
MHPHLLPVLLFAACANPDFVARKVIERSMPAANLNEVACTSHNGGISVTGDAAATEIALRAELSVRGYTQAEADANLEKLSVAEEVSSGTLKLYGKYDQFALSGMSPCFAFHVVVPRRIGLALESHNGSIEASGTQGTVSLVTHNGSIAARVDTNQLKAETHNGRVKLELGNQGRLDGEVVSHNGSVDVGLADGIGTQLEASTHNGDIEASKLQDAKMSRGTVRGRVGSGQGRLSITTHNGDVTIR